MIVVNEPNMICSAKLTATNEVSGPAALEARLLDQTSIPQRPKKVLIADDSLVFLGALSMKLRSRGYQVVICQQGARIVSLARSEKPDLILLDINFPPDRTQGQEESWDGLIVLEWLARLEETKGTPVMVITGEDPAKCRAKSYAAGAVAFFEKPVRPDALLPAIRSALKQGPES